MSEITNKKSLTNYIQSVVDQELTGFIQSLLIRFKERDLEQISIRELIEITNQQISTKVNREEVSELSTVLNEAKQLATDMQSVIENTPDKDHTHDEYLTENDGNEKYLGKQGTAANSEQLGGKVASYYAKAQHIHDAYADKTSVDSSLAELNNEVSSQAEAIKTIPNIPKPTAADVGKIVTVSGTDTFSLGNVPTNNIVSTALAINTFKGMELSGLGKITYDGFHIERFLENTYTSDENTYYDQKSYAYVTSTEGMLPNDINDEPILIPEAGSGSDTSPYVWKNTNTIFDGDTTSRPGAGFYWSNNTTPNHNGSVGKYLGELGACIGTVKIYGYTYHSYGTITYNFKVYGSNDGETWTQISNDIEKTLAASETFTLDIPCIDKNLYRYVRVGSGNTHPYRPGVFYSEVQFFKALSSELALRSTEFMLSNKTNAEIRLLHRALDPINYATDISVSLSLNDGIVWSEYTGFTKITEYEKGINVLYASLPLTALVGDGTKALWRLNTHNAVEQKIYAINVIGY